MPTLRFFRDRQGYESTYLLHAPKRRTGLDQPHLLYWFRSPPHVKIGRAAFDEDAIRLLEEQHPDVEFDWDRILTTRPPAAPETRDSRESRPARRPDRRAARDGRGDAPRPWQPSAIPEEVQSPPASTARLEPLPARADEPPPPPLPVSAARRLVRVFDAPAEAANVPTHHASEPSAAERLLGPEQLTVLRARYAEVMARISARGGDPARVEALRIQASAVDPDGWVTESDVSLGLAGVDATLSELHRIAGRRRRRRRRRRDGAIAVLPAGVAAGPSTDDVDDSADGADDADGGDDPDGPEEA